MLYDIKLHELTVEDYKLWRNSLDDSKLSTAYKNDILKFFKELLKHAERWYGYDFRDLYNKFDKFRDPNAIIEEGINYYTYEEFKKFISVENDLKKQKSHSCELIRELDFFYFKKSKQMYLKLFTSYLIYGMIIMVIVC